MGREVTIISRLDVFLRNILWLNIRRLKYSNLWRILYIGINLSFLISTLFSLPEYVYYYILAQVIIINILITNIKVYSKSETMYLLKLFGASKSFIIFDNIVEVLICFFVSFLLFCASFLLIKPVKLSFIMLFYQLLTVCIFTPAFTIFTLHRIERERLEK